MTRATLTFLTALLLIPTAFSFPTLNFFKRAARPLPYPIPDPAALSHYEPRQPPREPRDHYHDKHLEVVEREPVVVDLHNKPQTNNNGTNTLPVILEPNAETVWIVGETRNVTWTTTDENGAPLSIVSNTTNEKVELELRTRDVYVYEPTVIANVSLSRGFHTITVPSSAARVGERNDWVIVLVGKSSSEFIILPSNATTTPVPAGASTSRGSALTRASSAPSTPASSIPASSTPASSIPASSPAISKIPSALSTAKSSASSPLHNSTEVMTLTSSETATISV